jgi:ABC-type dipeptide/oligopeptide/nickel transport system permease component
MFKYVIRRLIQAIPVIIATTFLTFVLLEVVPGDPIAMMMKEHISPDVVERVRRFTAETAPAIEPLLESPRAFAGRSS